jgi:hypothetical protein
MNPGFVISSVALTVSIISVIFVFLQIRKNTNAVKAQFLASIIDRVHQDAQFQSLLSLIFRNAVKSHVDEKTRKTRILVLEGHDDVTELIDKLLGKFQILGHLLSLHVVEERDLQTLHFEIVATGRNLAIQSYLQYLNTTFIKQTGIIHDHFEFFKYLYLKVEEDADERRLFSKCLFDKTSAYHSIERLETKDNPEQGASADH